MSTKKNASNAQQRIANHKQQSRNLQLVAAGVIIFALAFITWAIFSANQDAAQTNPANTGELPDAPEVTSKQYTAAPPLTIDTAKQYFATIELAKGGTIVIQLFPDKAPITVNSFVFLTREGYFDGTTFHRVLDGFMAQGGDPTGTGGGGPGYQFPNEDSDLTFDKPGVVAMANAGRDTNGSQFFITFAATPWLDGGYTIFGQVVEGMDVVMGITLRDPQRNPDFSGDAIARVTIEEK